MSCRTTKEVAPRVITQYNRHEKDDRHKLITLTTKRQPTGPPNFICQVPLVVR